jgi:hypothetical protein
VCSSGEPGYHASDNPEHCVSQSGLFFGRALEREADWQVGSSDAPLCEWMSNYLQEQLVKERTFRDRTMRRIRRSRVWLSGLGVTGWSSSRSKEYSVVVALSFHPPPPPPKHKARRPTPEAQSPKPEARGPKGPTSCSLLGSKGPSPASKKQVVISCRNRLSPFSLSLAPPSRCRV